MLGREIQKFYNIDPQIAITFPLLIGTDGKKKMSQSYDNYISVTDTPENIFGKIMSIPDDTMWDYFLMLTDMEIKDIENYKKDVKTDKENPFNLKKLLGNLIITELFDDQTASKAYETFENITINKNIPDEIENIAINSNIELHLPKFLLDNNIIKSNSEGRRLISSGAFKINDEKYENLDINSDDLIDKTLQIGKRNFVRIIKK